MDPSLFGLVAVIQTAVMSYKCIHGQKLRMLLAFKHSLGVQTCTLLCKHIVLLLTAVQLISLLAQEINITIIIFLRRSPHSV